MAMPPLSKTWIQPQVGLRLMPAVPGFITFTPPSSWISASWVWP